MILMLAPVHNVAREIQEAMRRNGYTRCEELEPKAGCRRFRLS